MKRLNLELDGLEVGEAVELKFSEWNTDREVGAHVRYYFKNRKKFSVSMIASKKKWIITRKV